MLFFQKNNENDKEVLSVPKWMSQAFNNIDIKSDISEFEKEFKMQQSIKQYRPKHYFEFFKIIFNSPLYNSGCNCKGFLLLPITIRPLSG
jgi:hypothetical protein